MTFKNPEYLVNLILILIFIVSIVLGIILSNRFVPQKAIKKPIRNILIVIKLVILSILYFISLYSKANKFVLAILFGVTFGTLFQKRYWGLVVDTNDTNK